MVLSTLNDRGHARRQRKLFALFSAGLLAICLLRLPDTLSFENTALCEFGANLTAQYLVAHGYRPTLDFGYAYGLLPLVLERVWFAIFGLNPFAHQALMLTCGLAMAWALATIAESLALGAVGIALMFIAISVAIQVTYPSFAHALEAVLLSFALAEQCRGRLRFALAFAAVSIFAKPSMGYIYSLLLVVIVVAEARQNRIRFGGFIRFLTPAAVAFSAASILVGAAFGCRLFYGRSFRSAGLWHITSRISVSSRAPGARFGDNQGAPG